MPIKCPVAPLEFTFLAEAYFRERGIRDRVEMVYVTPLSGAFTKPIASAQLGSMLDERKVTVETDFLVERIDTETKTLVSYDEREVPFDLLVTVPLNMGADFVARSGLGDELNYVPVDKHTLLSTKLRRTSSPSATPTTSRPPKPARSRTSPSRSSSTTSSSTSQGEPMTGSFDGHANCFIESGDGKGLLIDFNYDTEPLTGKYPLPVLGPFSLLEENPRNHSGKLAFRWMYWNLLLPGRPIPLPAHMSMAGKHTREAKEYYHACHHHRRTAVHVDAKGFLTDPDEWDEDLAVQLAAQIGIELTDAHWKAIRFLREDSPPRARLPRSAGSPPPAGSGQGTVHPVPAKPAKKMAYIAGLPKPHGCV